MSPRRSVAQNREKIDPFSVSFLDIISCGFGAVVVLILIFKFDPFQNEQPAQIQEDDTKAAFSKIVAQAEIVQKSQQIQAEIGSIADAQLNGMNVQQLLQEQFTAMNAELVAITDANKALSNQVTSMNKDIQRTKVAGAKAKETTTPDEEVGGILVDRDYVIFIVDTSGSMGAIWPQIAARMSQILQQHPSVKGFQVMNDNGIYLISGYAKRWIPDTPKMRQRILRLFNLWSSVSNSSPVEGIVRALTDFQSSTKDISIYVLGDDFSGGDFDGAIENVRRLNKGEARINALNFISPDATTDRFSVLMREICLENNGTMLTL